MEIEREPPKNEPEAVPKGVGDGRSPPVVFAQPRNRITLKFEDVVYKVKTKSAGKETERTILERVSGAVHPGEMMAMMGPSGSGKTTLLTALGGRIEGARHRLTGSITYGGRPFSSSLRRSVGFVTQDDVLYPHLTVTETLLYTALLRLPSAIPRAEKASHAEAVMLQLGLVACRNSIIGGPLLRGVSGGERKRVSIGQEMLINPSLLFLDEPTSGLDSTTAARIVCTLRELARGGRTVVMTIHQPSSRLFYMFDKVLLLCQGHPVYYGKSSDAMAYFASVGYAPSVAMNPADFLLDIANGTISDETVGSTSAESVKEAIISAYDVRLRTKVLEEGKDEQFHEKDDHDKKSTQWCTTWWDQFKVLLERDLKERKHEAFSPIKIGEVIVIAVISGLLWLHSQGRVQDQVGFIFFVNGFWAFFPLFGSLFTFPQERAILTKERSSGMYRLSSYFFARMAGDLPMELVLPIVFLNISYWMAGLKSNAGSYFAFLFITLLQVLVAQGMGLAIGALVMDFKSGATLGAITMHAFNLAAGFYIERMPKFIAWLKYVSLIFYTFKLQIASQFSPSDTYQCAPDQRCKVADLPAIKATGFDHSGAAVAALFVLLVFFRLLAYLGLLRVGVKR